MTHDAISYKRFSTPKQARGGSDRRQSDLTADYCQRNRLTLLDSYLDAGLSGFTGQNLGDRGALRALLEAARAGKFKPGTRLVVESLDRLSRREISTAVRLFLDILDTGLVIVTLIDGEQVFTRERVDNDLTALIIVIVLLSRAHNESRTRRERALQALRVARQKARERKIPMNAVCPIWLKVEGLGDDRHFVVLEDRAGIIRQIYNLCISGLGEHRIVSYLNQRNVPTFSGRPKWRLTMVSRVLINPAVFGLFHPSFSVVENGRRVRTRDPDGPIEDYFPAILPKELWDEVQAARQSRCMHNGRRSYPAHSNLVAHLGSCATCGDSLYLAQGGDGFCYLRCVNVRDRECTNRLSFPYTKLEAVLLALDRLLEIVRRVMPKRLIDSGPRPEERFLARYLVAKTRVGSQSLPERLEARGVLVEELRALFEGVVLHPNRVLTLHMKPNSTGCRIAFVIGYEGVRGIQVKTPEGTVGFVDAALLTPFIRPVGSGMTKRAPAVWSPGDVEDVLYRTQILYAENGDWEAVVHDPTQMTDMVALAELTLRNGATPA